MPATATVLTFVLAAAAVVVVPGPSVVYVVARGVEHGRRAGMVSVLGLEAGSLAHLVAAVAGVAALAQAFPPALEALRWAGAGYLLWLAIRQVRLYRVACDEMTVPAGGRPTAGQLFRDGMLIDLLNPGTALFFLAFLPQFVDPARGSAAGQVLLLGGCYLALAVINDSVYAIAAGGLARRLTGSGAARRRMALGTAAVYLALALVALLL